MIEHEPPSRLPGEEKRLMPSKLLLPLAVTLEQGCSRVVSRGWPRTQPSRRPSIIGSLVITTAQQCSIKAHQNSQERNL